MPQEFDTTAATQPPATDVQNLAVSPQRVRTDEGTVEERPIDDVLTADVYNRLDVPKTVVGPNNLFGCAVARTRPSDSLGTQRRDPYGPRFL